MKNILKISYGFLIALFVLASCESDDNTGYSTIKPTDPTITISNIPASINFIEKDSLFVFNLTMSVAQVVDVAVYAKQIDGDAVVGEDFSIVNDAGKINFPAGSTTAQLKIKILSDNLKESTETFTIQIGDETTANATITPVNVPFTIQNATGNELTLDMVCSTDVKDAIGVDLKPDEVVDLRMLILKKSDMSVVKTIDDDKSSESFGEFSTLADDDYVIAVDILSTIDAGDINKPVNLGFEMHFFQVGLIDKTLNFEKVMTNENNCDLYRTLLATVKKAGNVYTVAEELDYWQDASTDPSLLVGTWQGWDADAGYPSEVVSSITSDVLKFKGIGRGWMQDAWEEVIVTETPVELTFNYCNGTVKIDLQRIMTTTYNGAPQTPYDIMGKGTFDMSGAYPVIYLQYDFYQGTAGIAKNFGIPYFELEITLDPAGIKVAKKVSNKLVKPIK